MKKIVDEIIENTPELEKEKDKLGKTVKVLHENNPKIIATKEFKNLLKNRLKSLVSFKQNKKNRFAIFAIPVFSAMFIIAGFFYYFDDIDFITNNEGIKLRNIDKQAESEIHLLEINEIGDMFEEELQNVINENEENNKKPVIQKNEVGEDSSISEKKTTRNLLQSDTFVEQKLETIKEKEQNINNISENESEVENSQIMEIFEALEEEYGDEFNPEKSTEKFEGEPMNSMFKGMEGIDSVDRDGGIEQEEFILEDDLELNFTEFCNQEGGKLTGTGELEKCIVDKKECLASQFSNGICEFMEIK